MTGPTIQGHPWKTTYTELSVQIKATSEKITDSLTLTDSIIYVIQHYEAYASEIVTGPPIVNRPWKTVYVEFINQSKQPIVESVTDSLTLTDSASYSLQLHGTYAPEIVTGPTIYWRTTYRELSLQINCHQNNLTDSLNLTDQLTYTLIISKAYAPEIVTGPPILGSPRKSTYVECGGPPGNTYKISITDTVILTDVAEGSTAEGVIHFNWHGRTTINPKYDIQIILNLVYQDCIFINVDYKASTTSATNFSGLTSLGHKWSGPVVKDPVWQGRIIVDKTYTTPVTKSPNRHGQTDVGPMSKRPITLDTVQQGLITLNPSHEGAIK